MGNVNEISVVLGSLRYKSAPNKDFGFRIPLVQNVKHNVEFDRISDIDLQQVYDDERQSSTIFRPTTKFSLVFKNVYAGQTNYEPFENNLYFINTSQAASQQCDLGASSVYWSGYPQYSEFDFIRNDYNVVGYTQPPNEHLIFESYSASNYNWNFFISYPFENDSTKPLQVFDQNTFTSFSWNSGDGIPFKILNVILDGKNIIALRCPIKHGMNVGEFIKFNNLNYNGESIFEVYSLGLSSLGLPYGNEDYIVNLLNIGYTGSTFTNGISGTFKRVILDFNTGDTVSKYYIRRHKIITNPNDAVLVKAGFEQNVYGVSKKFESSAYTPNLVSRVSIKEGSQSYTFSVNRDLDLNGLLDNLQRPLTELFSTVIWKGYFGWTTGKLKQGYGFNLPINTAFSSPQNIWDNLTADYVNPTPGTWSNIGGNFLYVDSFMSGDTLDGDLCEWNDYEQKERVISETYHKFNFNPTYFIQFPTGIGTPTNQSGYYYKPFYSIKLRDYSDYIETADSVNIEGLPNYAYFSSTLNQFIWRDIYTYGYIDGPSGLGVDYPFLNGGHYPFVNHVFRIIPEGTEYNNEPAVQQVITDGCE